MRSSAEVMAGVVGKLRVLVRVRVRVRVRVCVCVCVFLFFFLTLILIRRVVNVRTSNSAFLRFAVLVV